MRITIDPITRLEGHGRIEIFLNEDGEVSRAFLQIPEIRGFEAFCRGRLAEEMPLITQRICGVCPEAHHFASAKALDHAFNADLPDTARKLRELIYNAYIFSDHMLHFYYLGGPDFIVGPSAPKSDRNIIGVIRKMGLDFGREVIRHRAYGQKIIKIMGGRSINPVCGVPGGMSKPLSEGERQEIEGMASSCVAFGERTLEIFREMVLSNDRYLDMIMDESHILRTYYVGLVDSRNRTNFYDGDVRVVGPDGEEFAKFGTREILHHIEEHVEEWTYVKFPYLKHVGWKGLVDGKESGIYRVGPLGRINVADSLSTPVADEAFKEFRATFGSPAHHTLATHWARVIELINAAEKMHEIASDETITSSEVRGKMGSPGEGIGVIEAARGVLIHHYILDGDGRVERVNMIVATTNNNGAISMSVMNAARRYIHGGKVDESLLNLVEMAFRAYDPCLACASHFVGPYPLMIYIRDHRGKEVMRLSNIK